LLSARSFPTAYVAARLAALARGIRGRHLLVLDLFAVALSVYVALALRLDGLMTIRDIATYLPVALLPVIVRPIVASRFGLYRLAWAQASVADMTQILWATAVGSLVSAALFFAVLSPVGVGTPAGFPRSFWVMECVLSLAGICGSRFFVRALSDLRTTFQAGRAPDSLTPVILFGAGRTGAMMARSCRREPRAGVNPVGFLDDDSSKHGASVAGLPVFGGLGELDRAIARTGARMALITMPNAPGVAVRRVMDAVVAAGLEVRIMPAVRDLLDGSLNAFRVRQIRVEDLLSRQQVTLHAPGVDETIRGNVIMITGAGGSIGSELARQVYSFHPRKIVLVDRAESPLYLIQRELELRAADGAGGGELSVHLANVASRAAIGRLVGETQPAVIFHAAAYKHVPMMEEHPSEGAQVNIGGTLAVVGAAVAAGVPRFVLVSTDKAVEPSSVMGATKRLAEWIVTDAARRTGNPYVAVRFGNVLGSAGSILPILQGQLEKGEPLTITDPQMTRYFMTLREAGWLILDAAAIGKPGDLFVLDMGEPIGIMDMVRDLVRLAGRDMDTVPVRVTGLRPGEKLHEKLFYDNETAVQTDVANILRVKHGAPPLDIEERARALLLLAFGDRDDQLRTQLFATVAGPNASADGEDGSVEVRAAAAMTGVAPTRLIPPAGPPHRKLKRDDALAPTSAARRGSRAATQLTKPPGSGE
jgi:FlaA1/EpsC-like NDP-sugar epimerase